MVYVKRSFYMRKTELLTVQRGEKIALERLCVSAEYDAP